MIRTTAASASAAAASIHRGGRIHEPNHRHRYETRYIRFSSLDVVIHDDNVIQHGVEICKFNVASSSSFGWPLISPGRVCECAALELENLDR